VSADFRDRTGCIPRYGAEPDCIPIERFDRPLGSRDRTHAEGCLRCQAELALWRQFAGGSAAPDEGAGVRWVAAELRRRFTAASGRAGPRVHRRWPGISRLAAVAAVVAAVTAVYVVRDREPPVTDVQPASQQYRTVRIDAIAPLGDIDSMPRAIEWSPVGGAAVYDVEVFEVDRSTLWRGASSTPRIELPSSLTAQFAPGKPVFWAVKARSVSGVIVADSGTQRFRLPARKKH
jgi:hypothetical protein